MNLDTLRERIERVTGRIADACRRSGRRPEDVTLVAVSKTMAPEVIHEAYSLGLHVFGENRVQEARDKIVRLGPGPEWHLIGSLQSNKVRTALRLFSLIHSVDSSGLLEAIGREAVAQGLVARILFEVNVSGEGSKHGFSPDEALAAVHRAKEMPGIRLEGLMTMAPLTGNPEECRPVFRELRGLFDRVAGTGAAGDCWRTLSMGMSGDFEIAIEEGATLVRVGRAIFGER